MTPDAEVPVSRIADARPGDIARVHGTIGSILVEPGDAAPGVTATIADDSGEIDAVFMGRRTIAGIEPGRVVTIQGRVAEGEGRDHIFNPWYAITEAAS